MSEKKCERSRKSETERKRVRTHRMRERERSERLVKRAKQKVREGVRTEREWEKERRERRIESLYTHQNICTNSWLTFNKSNKALVFQIIQYKQFSGRY